MTRNDGRFYEFVFFSYFVLLAPVVLVGWIIGTSRLAALAELFWPAVGVMALLFALASGTLRFNRRLLGIVAAFMAIMAMKAIFAFLGKNETFGANGYFLEFKFILFASISLVVCSAFPVIDTKRIQKYFMFFAALEIVGWTIQVRILRFATTSLLSEQNYDGVLILIGYVLALKDDKLDWRKISLYFLATFLSQSRTGMFSFLALSAVGFRKMKNRALYWLLMAGLGAAAGYIFIRRLGNLKLESIDRLVMLVQYLETMGKFNASEWVWGTIPGVPLAESNNAMQYYITRQSLPLGLLGLHPFNFHGFLMRFSLSFGPVALLALGMFFYKEAMKERWKFFLYLLVLTQMFSLSVFYLTVMAVPLWVLIFASSKGEEIACSADGIARA